MGEKTKQRKRHTDGYRLMNRAVYYVSRMVSSQKERDFVRMNYDDIKKVFSIWLCMNMKENSVDYVHLVNEKLLGSHQWEGGLDLCWWASQRSFRGRTGRSMNFTVCWVQCCQRN